MQLAEDRPFANGRGTTTQSRRLKQGSATRLNINAGTRVRPIDRALTKSCDHRINASAQTALSAPDDERTDQLIEPAHNPIRPYPKSRCASAHFRLTSLQQIDALHAAASNEGNYQSAYWANIHFASASASAWETCVCGGMDIRPHVPALPPRILPANSAGASAPSLYLAAICANPGPMSFLAIS